RASHSSANMAEGCGGCRGCRRRCGSGGQAVPSDVSPLSGDIVGAGALTGMAVGRLYTNGTGAACRKRRRSSWAARLLASLSCARCALSAFRLSALVFSALSFSNCFCRPRYSAVNLIASPSLPAAVAARIRAARASWRAAFCNLASSRCCCALVGRPIYPPELRCKTVQVMGAITQGPHTYGRYAYWRTEGKRLIVPDLHAKLAGSRGGHRPPVRIVVNKILCLHTHAANIPVRNRLGPTNF